MTGKRRLLIIVSGLIVLIIAGGLDYVYERFDITPGGIWTEARERIKYGNREPSPYPAAAATRDERWQQDLDYLAYNLPHLHPNAFHTLPRSDFEADIAALRKKVPVLEDHEIGAGIMRIVASLDDGHTSCWRLLFGIARFPIQLYWFDDGLYVTRTDAASAPAMGCRLTAIGAIPVEQAAEMVGVYLPHGNRWDKLAHAPALLIASDLLHAAGVLANRANGSFTFVDPGGKSFTLELKPSFQIEWQPDTVPTPLYREMPDKNFWMRHLPDSRLLWIKFNQCVNGESFAAFTDEAMGLIDQTDIDTVVVDFRGNSGGNSQVFRPMHNGLRDRVKSRRLQIYGVIDRGTYSAATMNALALKRRLPVTLLGEPTGDRLNDYGEARAFSLPNSKIEVQHSTRYFKLADGDPEALMPDVHISLSSADYFAGRDPAFEAVVAGRPNPGHD